MQTLSARNIIVLCQESRGRINVPTEILPTGAMVSTVAYTIGYFTILVRIPFVNGPLSLAYLLSEAVVSFVNTQQAACT